MKRERDPDGVDTPATEDQSGVHENTRSSAEGVEEQPVSEAGGKPATGLIGNGKGVDPRYVAQR